MDVGSTICLRVPTNLARSDAEAPLPATPISSRYLLNRQRSVRSGLALPTSPPRHPAWGAGHHREENRMHLNALLDVVAVESEDQLSLLLELRAP